MNNSTKVQALLDECFKGLSRTKILILNNIKRIVELNNNSIDVGIYVSYLTDEDTLIKVKLNRVYKEGNSIAASYSDDNEDGENWSVDNLFLLSLNELYDVLQALETRLVDNN